MSLYRKRRSPFWHFDFWWRNYRFHGSTKCANRREAEKIEAAEREKAKITVAQLAVARTSLKLDDIAGRYWQEVGMHHADAAGTEHRLELLIKFFGKDRLLTEIGDDDVARLVAWRRGHRGRSSYLSPHTTNNLVEALRKLFRRSSLWGIRFAHEPVWRRHLLKVPPERVREVSEGEAELLAGVRDDYAVFIAFARASGLRLRECVSLTWSEVDWGARQIVKRGKGGRLVTVPITSEIRALLWPLRGRDPLQVFTCTWRGRRRPLSYSAVQSFWRRLRYRTGIDLRFHDLRHDFGTKLLRATGNLKLVQRALNHADIKTTTRYAHVLDDEVAAGMERAAKSRAQSHAKLRDVS